MTAAYTIILIITALLTVNIVKSRKNEKKYRETEERLRAIINYAPVILWEMDQDGIYTFCEGKGLEILGSVQNGALGRSLYDIYADNEKILTDGQRALRGETFSSYHKVNRFTFETHYIPLKSNNGNVSGAMGISFDVTESRNVQKEHSLLSKAVEQTAESIIITKKNGLITYINPIFEKISGFTLEEIKDRNFRIFKTNEHDESFYRGMWDTISRGKVWSGHNINRMKNGELREFETTISPIINSAGEIVNFVSVNRDVTLEIAMKNKLRHSQKMEAIGTLAGGIAHDFNNILSPIMGFTELILLEIENDTLIYGNLSKVLKAAERAKELVRQILTFCRGGGKQELKPVCVKPVAEEVLKLLRASLPSTIEIRQNIRSDLNVMSESTQIHQIIMNLCTNAAHAMRKAGGILEIRLEEVELGTDYTDRQIDMKPGYYLRLTVSDTGKGILPDVKERIFEPFFTTKDKGEGTGMGLSVVHGIVKGYGGTITVYSEPGKGSTFNVFLPVINNADSSVNSRERLIMNGNERILFVDDEEYQVDMCKQMLEHLGYNVAVTTSSLKALSLFGKNPDDFDLVMTDMTMPNMTGDILAKKIMSLRPDIPIILCTGYNEQISKEKAKSLGIRGFVMKPVVMKEMAGIVRNLLDGI
ncbi:PAS domain S-box protein [Desulfobacterales bacterium HSG17]|nr:PAS domain S-box protein [Desulfobacterales bacterium HSG17]